MKKIILALFSILLVGGLVFADEFLSDTSFDSEKAVIDDALVDFQEPEYVKYMLLHEVKNYGSSDVDVVYEFTYLFNGEEYTETDHVIMTDEQYNDPFVKHDLLLSNAHREIDAVSKTLSPVKLVMVKEYKEEVLEN